MKKLVLLLKYKICIRKSTVSYMFFAFSALGHITTLIPKPPAFDNN